MRASTALLTTLALVACGETQLPPLPDGALDDSASSDAGTQPDAEWLDAAVGDDAGGVGDAGLDAGDLADGGDQLDAGDAQDAGDSPDAGEEPDAGPPSCIRVVPTSQPLEWGECYSEEWPVYTGGMARVLATWFTNVKNGAAVWTDISDRGYYAALPMAWVFQGRNQPSYNADTYSLIRSDCSTGFCNPPKTNIPPIHWGQKLCVLSLDTGRRVTVELVDTGPGDSRRTALAGQYDGAQTWLDLSPGASAYLATGDAYGTPDNLRVTFWEGACQEPAEEEAR
ncbi:MAG: hypothetical protein ACOX6T_14720 [Myxococcales bacterium]|jgi:hypothetical protein